MKNIKPVTAKFKTDCIGQCHRLKGHCTGCGRSNEEIFDWIILSDNEKAQILKTPRYNLEE